MQLPNGLAPHPFLAGLARGLRPRIIRGLAQWSVEEMVLSSDYASRAGALRTFPYQPEILDELCNPHNEEVTIVKSTRTGGTFCINCCIAYHIDEDPAPQLYVRPTLQNAKDWCKNELAPMLRDVPALQGKVADPRSRDSGNTIQEKYYEGGHLRVIGGNSPAGFRGTTEKKIYFDDCDGIKPNSEGDPEELAVNRMESFADGMLVRCSTPTDEETSRTWRAFLRSDQRYFHVPCVNCQEYQVLVFSQFRWDKDAKGVGIPETTTYECKACEYRMEPRQKLQLIRGGEWQKTQPEVRGHPGFHIWAAYSPQPKADWRRIVARYLKAKGDYEAMKSWTNTVEGQVHQRLKGEGLDAEVLYSRREAYDAHEVLPDGIEVITAAVDVQKDRLEVEVVGWAEGEESYSLEYLHLMGDPGQDLVWDQLDEVRETRYTRQDGADLGIATMGIDIGGHHTGAVYDYVRPRQGRRVWALKGDGMPGKPVVMRSTGRNKGGVSLMIVGTEATKDIVHSRLKQDSPGPRCMHHPEHYPEAYFQGLTAERLRERLVRGQKVLRWEVYPQGRANEPWDLAVYNLAMYRLLNIRSWKKLAARNAERASQEPKEEDDAPKAGEHRRHAPGPKPVRREAFDRPKKGGGWTTNW